jgi:quercetin dioxygenase-like cupin family protein
MGVIMKNGISVISVIGLSLTCIAWADDLPQLGYSAGTKVKDLVAKGYRWVTIDGPYACATEKEVRQITSHRTDLAELQILEDGGAYYLIPGMLARVIRDDHGNGMSEILLGGISKPLWTYTRFLTARPIRNMDGIVETPETAGLIDRSDAEPQIQVQQILQTTQSWDGKNYQCYPTGQPQLTVLRITVPPNTALHWHDHPVISVGYVLSGHLTIEKRDTGERTIVHAGQTVAETVQTTHRGFTTDEPVELVVFYAGQVGLPITINEK